MTTDNALTLTAEMTRALAALVGADVDRTRFAYEQARDAHQDAVGAKFALEVLHFIPNARMVTIDVFHRFAEDQANQMVTTVSLLAVADAAGNRLDEAYEDAENAAHVEDLIDTHMVGIGWTDGAPGVYEIDLERSVREWLHRGSDSPGTAVQA